MKRVLLVVLTVAMSARAASGKPKSQGNRVSSQDAAATSHVAVLSVAPWEEYSRDLQPKFDLDAKTALEKALLSTRSIDDAELRRRAFELGIAPPTSTFAAQRQITVAADGTPTTTSSRTETRAGGDASKLDASSDSGDGMPEVKDLIRKLENLDRPAPADPYLQYLAASALFQEVQLLNRFVRDAAIASDERAYAVRLQISLMPTSRNRPYDAYTNIGFFPSEPGARLPRVVPLLVTDELELTSRLHARDEVRQFGLALGLLLGGFGADAKYKSFKEDFERVLGNDLNAVQTVARVNDNTLRVRFGALQQGSGHAMVPRTFNVTVLVLVPKGLVSGTASRPEHLLAIGKTDLLDAETGEGLAVRTNEAFVDDLRYLFLGHEFGIDRQVKVEALCRALVTELACHESATSAEACPGGESREDFSQGIGELLDGKQRAQGEVRELAGLPAVRKADCEALLQGSASARERAALQGLYEMGRDQDGWLRISRMGQDLHLDPSAARLAWSELTESAAYSQFSVTNVPLPARKPTRITSDSALASAHDEADKGVRVTLQGVERLPTDRTVVTIQSTQGIPAPKVVARLASYDAEKAVLDVVADPLKLWCNPIPSTLDVHVVVRGLTPGEPSGIDCGTNTDVKASPIGEIACDVRGVTVVKAPETKPEPKACAMKVTPVSPMIGERSGAGILQLRVEFEKPKPGAKAVSPEPSVLVSIGAAVDPKSLAAAPACSPAGAATHEAGAIKVTRSCLLSVPLVGLLPGQRIDVSADGGEGCQVKVSPVTVVSTPEISLAEAHAP